MTDRKGEPVAISWEWPESQILSYKIVPKDGTPLMAAKSIGEQLVALSKILEMSEDGLRWKTVLRAIYTDADGTITFDLAIAPKRSAILSHQHSPVENTEVDQ